MALLDVQNISVSVEEKQVLKNLSLQINPGETHVLMGPNGAGKSTLGNALMGNPIYTLNSGKIFLTAKTFLKKKQMRVRNRVCFFLFKILWKFQEFLWKRLFALRFSKKLASV